MAGKRRRYSAEFKAKVALDALKGELTVAQLVAKHGVHQTLINAWNRPAMEGMAGISSGGGGGGGRSGRPGGRAGAAPREDRRTGRGARLFRKASGR